MDAIIAKPLEAALGASMDHSIIGSSMEGSIEVVME
jgi:hypothetical protein